MRLLFDLETNGLHDRPDLKILCGAALDLDTNEMHVARPGDIGAFAYMLMRADELVGHNIAGFDLPVLDRLIYGFRYNGRIYDTRSVSRMAFPHAQEFSAIFRNAAGRTEAAREAAYPKRLLALDKLHSLEAWGYRLGERKDDYLKEHGVQEEFSEELLDYCVQDIHTNAKLYRRFTDGRGLPAKRKSRKGNITIPMPPLEACWNESRTGYLVTLQELNGVGFNEAAARELYVLLAGRRDALDAELRTVFKPWWAPKHLSPKEIAGNGDLAEGVAVVSRDGDAAYAVPKRSYKVAYPHPLAGRSAGCPFTPIELVEFNPASAQHVAGRLKKLYGWKPAEDGWTDSGQPKLDETVLAGLPYPEAPLLAERALVKQRIGQIAEGEQAWLKVLRGGLGDPRGVRIHGRILTHGTRTSRMSHSKPNMNIPKVGSPYGAECRACFHPTRKGWVMVGADASGIELRMLGHRLAFFDHGAFIKLLLEGDPHTEWMKASGIYIRNNQKTTTYAFLYGAGDPKLGRVRLEDWREAYAKGIAKQAPPRHTPAAEKELGAAVRAGLLAKVEGLDPLVAACKQAYQRGWVRAIDGRIIPCASEHGTLNDVLQSDAGITMKYALEILYDDLTAAGFVHGVDYAFMLNVHDEWQIECPPQNAEVIGRLAVEAIRKAGVKLSVRCPLDGEFKVGNNWMETH
jgi:DNA polymerase-1